MDKVKLYNAQGKSLFHVDISKAIDRGGEGSIVPHPQNNNQVIKIYHDGIIPSLTYEGWSYLNRLDTHFIKPLELYYNSNGSLAGFGMQMLHSSFFRISQLFTKSQCAKLGIGSILKEKIAHELVSALKEAHLKDIIIGDFNPYNIFVNTNGEIKVIDVDSFETPAQKHSGRLLDEIRDHYFMGTVSRESDYYALAITIFRLFTYVHPYKGVHKIWKQLEERAIKRISVLSNDADLTIPAFYEPIASKNLEDQFKRIFEDGERFLIQTDHISITNKPTVIQAISRADILIKIIASRIADCYFNETIGYIKTQDYTEIYECQFKGSPTLTSKISNNEYQFLWVGNKHILHITENKVYQGNEPIVNFEIPENFRFIQMDDIVFGVDWDNVYHIYPDKISNKNVAWSKTPCWGRGFKFEHSPIQLTGGIARTYYKNNNTINNVKLPVHPRNLRIQKNIGVITYIENEKVKHHWFFINGLQFEMCKETEEIFSFAVKETAGSTFVFAPQDGFIEILRAPDFTVVDKICFAECTSQSQLYLTNAGLLLLENQVLYLINRN